MTLSSRKVIVRADGSSQIGFGHIHRMLALVKALKPSFDCTFVSNSEWSFLSTALASEGIPLVVVDNGGTPQGSLDMASLLTGEEIVVVDGYQFDVSYQQRIKQRASVLVYVDDFAAGPFFADAVINHSPGVEISQYLNKSWNTRFFLGAKYALVEPPGQARRDDSSRSLLISMGGSDPGNATCNILRSYTDFLKQFDKIVLVIGPGYRDGHELTTLARQYQNLQVLSSLSKIEFYEVMHACSYAILSASTVAMEYATVGGALAVTKTADNQDLLYRGMLSLGCASTIDDLTSTENFDDQIKNQRAWFDGRSSERLINVFKELDAAGRIVLEEANESHIEITFKWAKDPGVRRYSFSRNGIPEEEHRDWFSGKIQDPECLFLIGRIDGLPFGSIRFDIRDNIGLISYLIDPEFQGQALGRSLLAAGMKNLILKYPQLGGIEGYVLPDNVSSLRNFERLAFEREDMGDRVRFYKVPIH